jgi:hypothetical protein
VIAFASFPCVSRFRVAAMSDFRRTLIGTEDCAGQQFHKHVSSEHDDVMNQRTRSCDK